MTVKRKIIVNTLATIAFIFLFLLPILGFMATETTAGQTAEAAMSTGDYVFFVVQDEDVPLAAVPHTGISGYILWIPFASFVAVIVFMYSAWYLTIRKNTYELTGKLSPVNRKAFRMSSGYFHPIRAYQLSKEAEATVASMYVNY